MAAKADTSKRIITGYASTFNNMDHGGDIVMPGAFAKTIADKFPRGKIKVLNQHNWNQPIGLPVDMREDSRGLFVSARISETKTGDEVLRLVADKVIDSFSIGFDIVKSEQFEDEEMRAALKLPAWWPMTKLTELNLWEFSPVTFPMNEQAAIIGVKTAFGWLPTFERSTDETSVETKCGIVLSASQAAAVGHALKTAQEIIDAAQVAVEQTHEGAKTEDGAAAEDLPSDSAAPSEVKADTVATGDFVSWEGGQGRVTSVDAEDETAIIQVFAGDVPTDAIIDLKWSELSVVDNTVPEPDIEESADDDTDRKALELFVTSMADDADEDQRNNALAALFT